MHRPDSVRLVLRAARALLIVPVVAIAIAAPPALAEQGFDEQVWRLPTTEDEPLPARAPPPSGLTAEASRLENGEGIARNYAMAADLYCVAAKKGDADAAYRLGFMYANARGMTRDDRIAKGLFRYAAERNHGYARRWLRYVNTDDGVLPACMVNQVVIAQESHAMPIAWTATPERQRIVQMVNEIAPGYGVEPRLALAIIQAESGFQVSAKSNKNAQGLMQLIPETAERFGVKRITDPRENVKGGLAYLRWLLSFFEGDVTLVTAAYNAGERAVERYRGIPPYAETRQYVARVTGVYGKAVHKYNPAVVEPSPMMAVRRLSSATIGQTRTR